jgi:hypothetical protein
MFARQRAPPPIVGCYVIPTVSWQVMEDILVCVLRYAVGTLDVTLTAHHAVVTKSTPIII